MIAAWILFLCGSALGIVLLYNVYLGFDSSSWPTTAGKVLKSEIQVRRNAASSGSIEYYHPIVIYEYVVNGKRVVSRRLGNYLVFGEKLEEAESIVARFPLGGNVCVYYHPRFGKVAALIPGIKQPLVYAILGFTAVIISCSAGAVIFYENPFVLIDAIFSLIADKE